MRIYKNHTFRTAFARLCQILHDYGFREVLRAVCLFLKANNLRRSLVMASARRRSKDGLVVKKVQGSKMYLDLSDTGLSTDLILMGIREEVATRILRTELKQGMTVVDVGANLGYYALMEASIVGKNGRVYAIEPVPRSFELLCRSISLNGYQNIVQASRVAISSKNGVQEMALREQSNFARMLDHSLASEYANPTAPTCVIKVESITIDDFLRNRGPVDFIRMDLEGFEVEVVKGMAVTLGAHRPLKMFLELHPTLFKEPRRAMAPLVQRLVTSGFRPKAVISRGTVVFDVLPQDFLDVVCRYPAPHVFLEKT